MSQEMNILLCSSCSTYQVHIVKKAKKWQCKICNFKQTLKQVYFKGSGKDCRLYVQKLNLVKEHKLEENVSFQECNIDDYSEQSNLEVVENKWAKYLDTPEEVQFDNFATSNSQGTSYHKSNNSVYLDDDNEMCECSDNDHTDMNNDFSYENTISQYSDYDNEKEDSNIKTEDKLDNISFNNDNSKSSDCHKCTENIFDDNEDFDLTINF
ncbi:MRN complex-interacting protein [Anthophora retusa]